jgi:YegS/Rv2252/BmrU family lipid kinase
MSAFRRILVIVNPSAGQHRTARLRSTIVDYFAEFDIDHDLRLVQEHDDTVKWTRTAFAEGFDLVVVAGGDGTVRHATEGLMRSGAQVPMAVIPTGTVNFVARSISMPLDVRKALSAIMSGKVEHFDVGYLPEHDRYFAFVCGAGYDGHIIHDTPRELKKKIGFLAYLAMGVKQVFAVRRVSVELEMDDVTKKMRAHTVMAVNIGSISNLNWTFGPNIDPHDGKLNIAVMSTRSLWGSIIVIFRILAKRFFGYAHLRHFEARRVRVSADPPLPFQVDGDPLGTTPFLAVVIPKALQFVVPIDYQP